MAATFNIGPEKQFFVGENKTVTLPVYGPDGATPVDVTGWTLIYVVKKLEKPSATPLITKEVGAGITLTGSFNANNQRVVIEFDSDDTAVLKPGVYFHTLKRTDPDFEHVLFNGQLTLLTHAAPV
jgi:hypothetical protein